MATLIKTLTDIKAPKVRLVLPEGHVVVDKFEAAKRAEQEGLDLILVQDGEVPVVKVADFKKIEYQKQKSTKSHHSKKPKQIRIHPHTQEYDMLRLAKQASEFIVEGHPTSLRMDVKGRDRMFKDLILKKMADFTGMVQGAHPGRITTGENGTYFQNLT